MQTMIYFLRLFMTFQYVSRQDIAIKDKDFLMQISRILKNIKDITRFLNNFEISLKSDAAKNVVLVLKMNSVLVSQ